MKVIVTGGRNYNNIVKVNEVLDLLKPSILVEGGANGADFLAKCWASKADCSIITIEANWNKHGKAAGPIRNISMLEQHPDAVVIAFSGGKGTAHCVKEALKRGMLVLSILET